MKKEQPLSISSLINYFSVSEDSKQKKFPQKSGTLTTTLEGGGGVGQQKVPLFFNAAPKGLRKRNDEEKRHR